jgi:glycosyltransferase involved in cell wall biosynthesis
LVGRLDVRVEGGGGVTTVTVLIPTIPPRDAMLQRALASVRAQTRQPDDVVVWVDNDGVGAAAARNTALEFVDTEFVAFLDDDDELLPNHLADLLATQEQTGADLVFPNYRGANEGMFADWLERDFDETSAAVLHGANFIPITILARTDAVKAVGGFAAVPGRVCAEEDWGCWVRLLDAGYTFARHDGVTWQWNGHYAHTSGHPWTKTVAASA